MFRLLFNTQGARLATRLQGLAGPSRKLCSSPKLQSSSSPGGHSYQPNNLEKKFLVWTGKYKTLEEVPNMVSYEVMERSRNRMRIRIANIMMGLTIFGCIIMVISGKRAAERGESVAKQNLEWHKQFNAQQPDEKEKK